MSRTAALDAVVQGGLCVKAAPHQGLKVKSSKRQKRQSPLMAGFVFCFRIIPVGSGETAIWRTRRDSNPRPLPSEGSTLSS